MGQSQIEIQLRNVAASLEREGGMPSTAALLREAAAEIGRLRLKVKKTNPLPTPGDG